MKNLNMKYRIKSIILLLLLIMHPAITFSQLSDWENYTNGNMVTKILNDGDYLWIATDGGLVKMNKNTEEKTFYNRANAGLPDNHLRSLAKDKDGNIWVTTQYNGIGKFDGTDCVVYKESNSELPTSHNCTSIAIDNNNDVWAGTHLYLNKFDRENWESWTTPNSIFDSQWAIYDLKFDDDGVLWLGGESVTSGFYFARFTGSEIQKIDGIHKTVLSIAFDGENNKWLGTATGLIKYDGTNFTAYNTNNSFLPDNIIYDVKKDASGNLWLASGRYLVKFDGTDFTTYTTPLITDDNNFIYCLEVEDDGTIWIGTRRNGLVKFSDGLFRQINVSNSPLLTNDISFSLDIDRDNNVRFGTKHNLVKIDADNNWSSSYEKINYFVADRRINGAASDLSGKLWLAFGLSDTCVLKVNNNSTVAFTQQNSPLFSELPDSRFCFDKKGNTWLASMMGLYKYDGTDWQRFTPANSPLRSYQINDLVIDKDDNLWGAVGNANSVGIEADGCLFKYDGTNWTIYTTENSELPRCFVTEVAIDSLNNIWTHCRDVDNVIGCEAGGGLTKFDGATWTTYNIDNSGIPSNSILDIAVDKDDNLWLATIGRVGVTKYDGTNWQSYNVDNSGIAFDEVSKITLDYHRDLVWFNHLNLGGLSTAKLNSATGIPPLADRKMEGFTVYPNPAISHISLRLNDIVPETIHIYDISGKMIASRKADWSMEHPILLSELNINSPGLYLIKITDRLGKACTQKLTVKR
ncbi:MAG: T9SS type A sorting domain-containing protein [Prevotellaceae bacterium]|jgi:ligand-binding sensor domain-containing protein|nr:T9SS type A sorting domain-containing protein [Prevotellaceae bacterium]